MLKISTTVKLDYLLDLQRVLRSISDMADDERRTKRSRFDQTEAPRERRDNHEESRRSSRFDRRSRSPSIRDSRSARSRSPLGRETLSPGSGSEGKKPVADPAAAAGKNS